MRGRVEDLAELVRLVSSTLPPDVEKAIAGAAEGEAEGSGARSILGTILSNVATARAAGTPLCQDTGSLAFVADEALRGELPPEAFAEAAALATAKGWLRRNTIETLTGKSIDTNACPGAPAVKYVPAGGGLVEEGCVRLLLKGGGSENMSVQYSLPDAKLGAGRDLEGVRRCALAAVHAAQGYGCAPGVLGICAGGDRAAGYEWAKMQFLRALDDENPEPELAGLEKRILEEANGLGVGPMGLGGATTLLGVKIGVRPRLPACYFVTVAYMCWALRRGTYDARRRTWRN